MTQDTKTNNKATSKTNKNSVSVAAFLNQQIGFITQTGEKTQKDIAAELGYDKPNIITMFKQGVTSLPINKVLPMAKSLHADPGYLMRLALMEYMPEAYAAIEEVMGVDFTLTDNERELIKMLRTETKNADPSYGNLHNVQQVKKMVAGLQGSMQTETIN